MKHEEFVPEYATDMTQTTFEEICKDNGIDPNQYLDTDFDDTPEEIEDLVRRFVKVELSSRYGWFKGDK